MVWLYSRGADRRSCETRLAGDGEGYELVIEESGTTRIERFARYWALLAQEHEILTGWIAQGWRLHRPAEHTSAWTEKVNS